jgi:ABC-type transport system substrate-binding protein
MTARVELFKEMQAMAADEIPWIPASIATMGGAWWTDKVSNVTAGATQYSYPWTYQLPTV